MNESYSFQSKLSGEKEISDLPTYKEIENLYCNTYDVLSCRRNFMDLLNELPLLESILDTRSHNSGTHNHIYSKKYEKNDLDYWKRLKIDIEIANHRSLFIQGDIISGKVVISNESSTIFPYLLCSVALVGNVLTPETLRSKVRWIPIEKFLMLTDFKTTSELTNMGNNDSIFQSNEGQKYLMPSDTHSSSFMFKIPESLLSDTCNLHELPKHCNLLPSKEIENGVGHSHNITRKDKVVKRNSQNIDMVIRYNIEVSVIGKLSDYKNQVSGDYNITIAKKQLRINIDPYTNINSLYLLIDESSEAYMQLIKRVKKMIAKRKDAGTNKKSNLSEKEGLSRLENHLDMNFQNPNHCILQSYCSYVKSKSLWYTKYKGNIKVQIPKKNVYLDILSGHFYCISQVSLCSRFFLIPIEFELLNPNRLFKFCMIEKVSAELMCLRMTSRYLRIPIVIGPDLLFGSKVISDDKDFNPIEENIKRPLFPLLNAIRLLKMKSSDYSLIADVQSLVNLGYCYEMIKISNWNEILIWSPDKEYPERGKSKIVVTVDGKKLKSNFEELELEQDFQSCYINKFYYLKIRIKIHDMGNIFVHVPLTIKRNIRLSS